MSVSACIEPARTKFRAKGSTKQCCKMRSPPLGAMSPKPPSAPKFIAPVAQLPRGHPRGVFLQKFRCLSGSLHGITLAFANQQVFALCRDDPLMVAGVRD